MNQVPTESAAEVSFLTEIVAGGGGSGSILLRRLRGIPGCKVHESAAKVLSNKNFPVLFSPVGFNLVVTTSVLLGLSGEPSYDQVLDRAKKYGLQRCEPEIAPTLLINRPGSLATSKHWTANWRLIFGMVPFVYDGGCFRVFAIGPSADGGAWIEADNVQKYYGELDQIVFVKPIS